MILLSYSVSMKLCLKWILGVKHVIYLFTMKHNIVAPIGLSSVCKTTPFMVMASKSYPPFPYPSNSK